MSSKFATCITCDRPLAPDETVSGFCPRCLFVAGTIPQLEKAGGAEPNTLTSSWSEAFPQFEAQQILREEAGFRAIRGTLHSDEFEDGYGAAVLLVWSGPALAGEGGEDFLLAQIEMLRLAPCTGVASVLDAGDLIGGVYLLAQFTSGAKRWGDSARGSDQESKRGKLPALLPELGRLTARVRSHCGVELRLDPALHTSPTAPPPSPPDKRPGTPGLEKGFP